MQINKQTALSLFQRREKEDLPFVVLRNYRKLRIMKKTKELRKSRMEKLKM
jgi:hypothetical protein